MHFWLLLLFFYKIVAKGLPLSAYLCTYLHMCRCQHMCVGSTTLLAHLKHLSKRQIVTIQLSRYAGPTQ